jgi:hypothetical protein
MVSQISKWLKMFLIMIRDTRMEKIIQAVSERSVIEVDKKSMMTIEWQ